MPLLGDSKSVYVGTTPITKVMAGSVQVWPKGVLAQNLRCYRGTSISGISTPRLMLVWESYPVGECCGSRVFVPAYAVNPGGKLIDMFPFGCYSTSGYRPYSYLPQPVPGLIEKNTMVCSSNKWNPGSTAEYDVGVVYYPVPGMPADSGEEIARLTVRENRLEEIPPEFLQNRCP